MMDRLRGLASRLGGRKTCFEVSVGGVTHTFRSGHVPLNPEDVLEAKAVLIVGPENAAPRKTGLYFASTADTRELLHGPENVKARVAYVNRFGKGEGFGAWPAYLFEGIVARTDENVEALRGLGVWPSLLSTGGPDGR